MNLVKRIVAGIIDQIVPFSVILYGFGLQLKEYGPLVAILLFWGAYLSFLSFTVLSIRRGTPGDILLGIYYIPLESKKKFKYWLILRGFIISCFVFGLWASANPITTVAMLIPITVIYLVNIGQDSEKVYVIDFITRMRQVSKEEYGIYLTADGRNEKVKT